MHPMRSSYYLTLRVHTSVFPSACLNWSPPISSHHCPLPFSVLFCTTLICSALLALQVAIQVSQMGSRLQIPAQCTEVRSKIRQIRRSDCIRVQSLLWSLLQLSSPCRTPSLAVLSLPFSPYSQTSLSSTSLPHFKPNPLSTLLFTSYSLPFLPNHLSPLYLSTLPFSGAERSSAQVLEWEAWRSTHSCRHSQQSRARLPCLVWNHGPGSVSARTRPLIQHRGEGKGGEGDRSRPGCYLCAPSSRSLSEPHLLLLLLLLLSFSPSSPWLILPFLSNAFYHTSRPSFFPSLSLSFFLSV